MPAAVFVDEPARANPDDWRRCSSRNFPPTPSSGCTGQLAVKGEKGGEKRGRGEEEEEEEQVIWILRRARRFLTMWDQH